MTEQSGRRAGQSDTRRKNRKLDEEIEESFPASDPPAFAGGKSFIGAPKNRETPPRAVQPRQDKKKPRP